MNHDRFPHYVSHKIVEAFKVSDIFPAESGGARLFSLEIHGPSELPFRVDVSPEYVERHKPRVGGYWMRYKDGYESWSPSEAFLDGYTRLAD